MGKFVEPLTLQTDNADLAVEFVQSEVTGDIALTVRWNTNGSLGSRLISITKADALKFAGRALSRWR